MGAVRYGDHAKANSELNSLERMHGELKNRKDDYKATQVQIQINSIKAWLLFEKGKVEEALALMTEASKSNRPEPAIAKANLKNRTSTVL